MGKRPVIVLSLVERGWQAARECSLDIHRRGVCVIHLIKGTVEHAVRALIAPEPHIHLMSVARSWFWPTAWLFCTALTCSGRLRAVLVDNERSFRRLRGWTRLAGVNVIMVRNGREGYEVWAGSRCLARSTWHQLLASHAARALICQLTPQRTQNPTETQRTAHREVLCVSVAILWFSGVMRAV